MHSYRTHNCNQLNKNNVDQKVKLSGWIHSKRDHGSLLFIDLRDHYGITQCVIDEQVISQVTGGHELEKIKLESVITVTGKVVPRTEETINPAVSTGEIEVKIEEVVVQSYAQQIPLQINTVDYNYPESLRLKYRFLDLRYKTHHDLMILRSELIHYIRNKMIELDFLEIHTPILTASSPEGAKDFLVPSRIHKGKFYALPQAPQQFKQLLMISGFDKYFQIAPCFRDEDSRADRSPGEFYQLDLEMAFATQEEVLELTENVIVDLFTKFSDKKIVKDKQDKITRISYNDAMEIYGSDKPDLRNPLTISKATEYFIDSNFKVFKENIQKKQFVVKAILVKNKRQEMSRAFFDKMIDFTIKEGGRGLAYIDFDENCNAIGPIAKFLTDEAKENLKKNYDIKVGDVLFFVCDENKKAQQIAGKVRIELGNKLNLVNKSEWQFCWVIDFPYFEKNETTGNIEFSHNPFSMPKGGLKILQDALGEEITDEKDTQNIQNISQDKQEALLNIVSEQYDLVCNGVELSSGAIRNHSLDILYKAFSVIGYSKEQVDNNFSAMVTAFQYGVPPHGGIAPGIERMIMLLADIETIRDVMPFPLNANAQDLMMNAPSDINDKDLQELGICRIKSEKKDK